jgi:8-hydroxy-5-deazaflavin:NADPH oxidoreductase
VRIGIIGAGNVGKALATAAVRAGHDVTLSASRPESATEGARATGARAAATNKVAVQDADLVILAVPSSSIERLALELASDLKGKAVLDTINRVNLKDPSQVLDGTSHAERVQTLLPGSHVVKALNTVFFERMTAPAIDGLKLDGFVAADDEAAKKRVLEFVGSIGFRPLDAGPLAMARALEAMALLIISLQIRNGWPRQNGWKLVGPPGD